MKKCIKICSILFAVMTIFCNLSLASSFSDYQTNDTNEIVANIESGVDKATTTVNSLAYTIVDQVSDKSLPICALLILWGAVLYFILGIRNLYKKRQGLLLMWGAFTFVVLAKIVNFVFWFAFIRA